MVGILIWKGKDIDNGKNIYLEQSLGFLCTFLATVKNTPILHDSFLNGKLSSGFVFISTHASSQITLMIPKWTLWIVLISYVHRIICQHIWAVKPANIIRTMTMKALTLPKYRYWYSVCYPPNVLVKPPSDTSLSKLLVMLKNFYCYQHVIN